MLNPEIAAELERARAAGETHQLGRAFVIPSGDFNLSEVQAIVSAIDPVDAARYGAGVMLRIQNVSPAASGDRATLNIFLDENAKLQLREQIECNCQIVDLHRAIAAEGRRLETGTGPNHYPRDTEPSSPPAEFTVINPRRRVLRRSRFERRQS